MVAISALGARLSASLRRIADGDRLEMQGASGKLDRMRRRGRRRATDFGPSLAFACARLILMGDAFWRPASAARRGRGARLFRHRRYGGHTNEDRRRERPSPQREQHCPQWRKHFSYPVLPGCDRDGRAGALLLIGDLPTCAGRPEKIRLDMPAIKYRSILAWLRIILPGKMFAQMVDDAFLAQRASFCKSSIFREICGSAFGERLCLSFSRTLGQIVATPRNSSDPMRCLSRRILPRV